MNKADINAEYSAIFEGDRPNWFQQACRYAASIEVEQQGTQGEIATLENQVKDLEIESMQLRQALKENAARQDVILNELFALRGCKADDLSPACREAYYNSWVFKLRAAKSRVDMVLWHFRCPHAIAADGTAIAHLRLDRLTAQRIYYSELVKDGTMPQVRVDLYARRSTGESVRGSARLDAEKCIRVLENHTLRKPTQINNESC